LFRWIHLPFILLTFIASCQNRFQAEPENPYAPLGALFSNALNKALELAEELQYQSNAQSRPISTFELNEIAYVAAETELKKVSLYECNSCDLKESTSAYKASLVEYPLKSELEAILMADSLGFEWQLNTLNGLETKILHTINPKSDTSYTISLTFISFAKALINFRSTHIIRLNALAEHNANIVGKRVTAESLKFENPDGTLSPAPTLDTFWNTNTAWTYVLVGMAGGCWELFKDASLINSLLASFTGGSLAVPTGGGACLVGAIGGGISAFFTYAFNVDEVFRSAVKQWCWNPENKKHPMWLGTCTWNNDPTQLKYPF
jgi:hypothetical protein